MRILVIPRPVKCLVAALFLAAVTVLTACGDDGAYYIKVVDLDSVSSDERVRVGGLFAEPPVSTPSGTVFTMADPDDRESTVRVIFSGIEPVTASRGSEIASGSDLLWTDVIVTGYFVDGVIVSDDMIVKNGGGYVEP